MWVKIGRGPKDPPIGLLNENNAALRAVRLKRCEYVVGAKVRGQERSEQPPRRRARTGKDQGFGQTKKSGGDSSVIHGASTCRNPSHSIQSV